MAKKVEAIVKPEILLWARKSAALDVATAAKKVQVKQERLESWERGDTRPTLKQLRKLGKAYKRPIAVFYLPEPPMDFEAIHDFRRLPGEIAGHESPELRFEIRRAQNRRELAIELYELIEGPPPAFPLNASLSDDPERVARKIREFLVMRYEDQVRWSPGYDAFNHWRAALENSGVLVFQAPSVDVTEMRGFSISRTPFPVIVVNIKDSVRGRIFTMLHEFTHIVLRKGGLCDLYEESPRPPEEQKVEIFCNWVAGATLVPQENLLREELVITKRPKTDWTDEEVRNLADRYGVSREVLLRRLLICERITEDFYREKRKQFEEKYEAGAKRRERGFAPPHRIAISTAGNLFIKLVLGNYHQDKITASDVADFLEVRLKHLSKIETEVLGRSSKAGAIA